MKNLIIGVTLLVGVFVTSCRYKHCEPLCKTVPPDVYEFISVDPLTFRYNHTSSVFKALVPKGTYKSSTGKVLNLSRSEFTYKVQDGADWIKVDERGIVSVSGRYTDTTTDRKGSILVTLKADPTKTFLAEVIQTKVRLLEDNPLAYIAHENIKADGSWSNAIPKADGSDRDELLLEWEQSKEVAKNKKDGDMTYHIGNVWEWNAISPFVQTPNSFFKDPNVDLNITDKPSNRFLLADPQVPATIGGKDYIIQTEHYNPGKDRISYGRYTYTNRYDSDDIIYLAIRYNWDSTPKNSGMRIKACVLPDDRTSLKKIQEESFWEAHKEELVERFFPGCGGVNFVKKKNPTTGEETREQNWHNKYREDTPDNLKWDVLNNGYYWTSTPTSQEGYSFNCGMYNFTTTVSIRVETGAGNRNSLRLFSDKPIK